MTTFQIKADANLSKAEEIAQITKLEEKFQGTGCYLESLFSPAFSTWVENKIKSDIMPDVIDEFSGMNDMYFEAQKLRTELENERSGKEALRQVISQHEANLANRAEEVQHLRHELEASRSEVARLEHELVNGANAMCDMENEMMRLKAMLFDLQNAAK